MGFLLPGSVLAVYPAKGISRALCTVKGIGAPRAQHARQWGLTRTGIWAGVPRSLPLHLEYSGLFYWNYIGSSAWKAGP